MSFQLHPDTTLGVVHLYVSNIKKSLEFYTEVLSMKVLKEDEMVVTFGNENNEPLLIIEEKKEALPKQRGENGFISLRNFITEQTGFSEYPSSSCRNGISTARWS